MARYEMPDGNIYELEDSEVATVWDSFQQPKQPQNNPGIIEALNPANMFDYAAGSLAGLFGAEEDKKAIMAQREKRMQAGANQSVGDTLKGVGTAAADIVGGGFGIIPGAVAGGASAAMQGDLTKGMDTAKEVMGAFMPSTYMDSSIHDNSSYQGVMQSPIFGPLFEGPAVAAKGYGDLAGLAGASPQTQAQISSGVELAMLAGFGKAQYNAFKGKTNQKKTTAEEDAAAEFFKERETPKQETQQKPSEVDAEIAAKEQPQFADYTQGESRVVTEEGGLTPASTMDVVSAQGRMNQSAINAEMGGGIFIRDRSRINELTKDQPRARQEDIAWEQNKAERIDPEIKALQESLAWEQRTMPEFQPQQKASGLKGFGRSQKGAIDPEVFVNLFSDFKNSKVVDMLGKLKPVYHGTTKEFAEHSIVASRGARTKYDGDIGVWFTDHPSGTDTFAGARTGVAGGNVHQAYIKLTNPKVFNSHKDYKQWYSSITEGQDKSANYVRRGLIQEGYDGIEIRNSKTDGGPSRTDYLVLDTNNIKSAISPQFSGKMPLGKQRGSVGFNGKKPQLPDREKFIKLVMDKGASREEAVAFYDKKYGAIASQQETNQRNKALSKISKQLSTGNDYIVDGANKEAVMQVMSDAAKYGDIDPGFYTKELAPRGRISAEIIHHPYVSAGIAHIKHITDSFAKRTEEQLFGHDGIIFKITKAEKLFTPGSVLNLFSERFKAKGSPEYKQKLNPTERALDKDLDKLFEDQLKEVNEVLAKKAEASGRKFKPIEGLHKYMPDIWEGDWTFSVKRDGGKPIILSGHNKHIAKVRAAWLKSKGFEVSPVSSRSARHVTAGFDPLSSKVDRYEAMLDYLTTENPEIVRLRNEINSGMQASAAVESGFNQRLKDWHGFKGALGNDPFASPRGNFYNAKKALTQYVESHNAWLAAHKLADFNKDLSSIKNAPTNAENYVRGYIEDIVGMDRTGADPATFLLKMSEAITGSSPLRQRQLLSKYATLATIRFVGVGSIRALTQNFFQPLSASIPVMLHHMPEVRNMDMLTPLVWGLTDYTNMLVRKQAGEVVDALNMGSGTKINNVARIIKKESQALEAYATERGILDITILESDPFFKRKAPNIAWKYGSGMLSRASEQAARFATFTTLYRWHRQAGYENNQAMRIAADMTQGHMVDYAQEARARVFQSTGTLGTMAGRLQTYKANELGRYALYTKVMMRDKNPVPLLGLLSVSIGLAGISGFIGLDIIDNLWKLYTTVNPNMSAEQREFSPRAYVAENFNKYWSSGIPSATTNKGISPAMATTVFGGNPLQGILPVYGDVLEQGRTIGRRLFGPSWEEETQAEKGRQVKSVTPAAWARRVEEEFLTQEIAGEKYAISPYTGDVTYKYRPEDSWFGNIQPLGKTVAGQTRHEFKNVTKRQEEAKKNSINTITDLATDIFVYGNRSDIKINRLNKLARDYVVKQGGDPASLESISEKFREAALPDPLYKAIMEETTRDNVATKQRASRYLKIQENQR